MEYAITGGMVEIDEKDLALVSKYKWHIRKMASGIMYAATTIYLGKKNGKTVNAGVYMHRLLLGLEKGDKRVADHKNGDGLDNQRHNLRITTHAMNMANRKTKYGGIQFTRGKWRATIQFNRKQMYLGRFSTKEEAAAAYQAASVELRGEFSRN